MKEKIIEIMKTIFESTDVDESTTPDKLENWDSLRHMNLVVALEEEFGVEFDEDDIVEMLSLDAIMKVIESKK